MSANPEPPTQSPSPTNAPPRDLFPTASPQSLGVNPQTVGRFVAAAAERGVELHSLAILRRGTLIAQQSWTPWTVAGQALIYSVSKTITATCIGLLAARGALSVDDLMVDLLGDQIAEPIAPGIEKITVRHLLSMATGHTLDTLPAIAWHDDPVTAFCQSAPQAEPGSVFCYNNGATWMLGEIVRVRSGMGLADFAVQNFLAPLGIRELTWQTDEAGRELGFSGAHLSALEIAAITELYRCDGVWHGERLLPEGWVELASAEHISTAAQLNPHSQCGYGFQLWGDPAGGYRLDGASGQYGIVMPDQEAVVAITAGAFPTVGIHQLVAEILVPALSAPIPEGGTDPDGEPQRDPVSAEVPWTQETLPTEAIESHGQSIPRMPADAPAPWWFPEVTSARLQPAGDQAQIELAVDGQPLVLHGGTEWTPQLLDVGGETGVPVAVRVSTHGPAVRVGIAFTDTPHLLTLQLTEGEPVELWWNCPALNGGPIHGLTKAFQSVTAIAR